MTGKARYGRLWGFCGIGAHSLPVVGQGLASFLRMAFNLSGSGIVLCARWRAVAAHQVHTGLVRYKSIGHDLVEMFNRHGIHGYSYWRWGSAPRCSGLGRCWLLRLDGGQVEQGAIIGALVMQSLKTGMVLIGFDAAMQDIVVGVVLVLAVFLDILYRRKTK